MTANDPYNLQRFVDAQSRWYGDPDDLKFHSCMTLFANTTGENKEFRDALKRYFAGKPDQLTMDRLRSQQMCGRARARGRSSRGRRVIYLPI